MQESVAITKVKTMEHEGEGLGSQSGLVRTKENGFLGKTPSLGTDHFPVLEVI